MTMNWKQKILLVGLGLCSGHALATPFPIQDADAWAMAGAGVAAATDYLAMSNAALIDSTHRGNEEFMMSPMLHVMLTNYDNFSSALDRFKDNPTQQNLAAAEGEYVDYNIGGGFGVVLRDPKGSSRLHVAMQSMTRSEIVVDPSDLSGAPPAEYLSTVKTQGITLLEAGVTFTSLVNIPYARIGQINMAVTGKIVTGKVHNFSQNIEIASIDGLYSTGESTLRPGIDVAAMKELGKVWGFGLVIKDLIPSTYSGGDGPNVTIGPQVRGGVAYLFSRLRVTMDLDLLPTREFASFGRGQMVAAGGSYRITNGITLRAGYRYDLQANQPDLATAGLFYKGQVIHLGGVVISGSDGTQGLSLQAAVGF